MTCGCNSRHSLLEWLDQICQRDLIEHAESRDYKIRKYGDLARLLQQVPGQYFSVLLLVQANRLDLHVVEGLSGSI